MCPAHPQQPTQGAVYVFPPARHAVSSHHPHIAGSVALTQHGAARRCLLFLARSLPLPSPQDSRVRGHRVPACDRGAGAAQG